MMGTQHAQFAGRSRQVAFSLVELLVVITIILLLASMVAPSLQSAKEAARRAVCGSNLHQLAVGHETYKGGHGATYCRGRDYLTTQAPQAGTLTGIPGWPNISTIPEQSILVLRGYVSGEKGLFMCPSDDGQRRDCGGGIQYIRPPSFSFTRNGHIGGVGGGGYLNTRSVRRPSDTFMLLEEWEQAPFNDSYAIPNSWDMISQRHSGRGQMAFFDAHVKDIDGQMYNQSSDLWRLEKYFDP